MLHHHMFCFSFVLDKRGRSKSFGNSYASTISYCLAFINLFFFEQVYSLIL